jgi:hypothetical protein
VNDDVRLNETYRAELISEMRREGYEVCSLGVSSAKDVISLILHACIFESPCKSSLLFVFLVAGNSDREWVR